MHGETLNFINRYCFCKPINRFSWYCRRSYIYGELGAEMFMLLGLICNFVYKEWVKVKHNYIIILSQAMYNLMMAAMAETCSC